MAAAATWLPVFVIGLSGLFPSCPYFFVQLVVIVGNRWIQQLHPVFEWRDCAARSVVTEEVAIPTSLFAIAARPSLS